MTDRNRAILDEVLDELRWEAHGTPPAIGVAVVNGIVSLFGEVDSERAKHDTIRAVERIDGVRAIAESLVVRTPDLLRRTDVEIARDVADRLERQVDVPDSVKAHVEDGWLWLEGDVDWPFQRMLAEEAVRAHPRIAGLRGVTNAVVIARPATLPAILGRPMSIL